MERLKQLHGYVLVPFAIATLFTGCKEESLNDAGPRDGGLRELGHHEDGGGMNVAPLTPTLVWNGPSRMTSLGADTDHIVWVEPKSSETDEYGDPLVQLLPGQLPVGRHPRA